MKKSNYLISTTLFLVLVILIFLSIAILTGRVKHEEIKIKTGYADLSNFDFEEKIAQVSHTSFLYYNNELYTPEDFKTGRIIKQPLIFEKDSGRVDPGNYGTYYIVLNFPNDGLYGISSYSAMYSQRLFINGVEYPSHGLPGKDKESTIHLTKHYTAYFQPEKGKVELVIQFANFGHADFGGITPIYVGTQENIMERNALAQQRVHILAGSTFTSALFFLGMFIFFKKNYAFMWFSISCFSVGIRTMIVNEKVIMFLFPNLPWHISIGLEFIVLAFLLFSFLLYICNMFKGVINKAVQWAYAVFCLMFVSFVLLTPTIVFTAYMLWFQLVAVPLGIYVLLAIIYYAINKKDNIHTEHILIYIGAIVFITLSILDIQIHRSIGQRYGISLVDTGMMVFIFSNMIALVLQFSRTQAQLDEAQKRENEMQETNILLDKMSQLKTEFMANISHEMRTPLTIMASYAGLTSMQLKHNATDVKTIDNLAIIQREAIRLADMVERLKDVSLEKNNKKPQTDIKASALIKQAVDFCIPICLKNKNKLFVAADSEDGVIYVNGESIFQTLVNLIINANRHTKEGIIELKIKPKTNNNQDLLVITVSDNGEGISTEIMPYIFERGVSSEGSTGLGLPICKEIIEENSGEISIESEIGKGTTVSITLHYKKN